MKKESKSSQRSGSKGKESSELKSSSLVSYLHKKREASKSPMPVKKVDKK